MKLSTCDLNVLGHLDSSLSLNKFVTPQTEPLFPVSQDTRKADETIIYVQYALGTSNNTAIKTLRHVAN